VKTILTTVVATATAIANDLEATHDPTKAPPEPAESRKYPETYYHYLRCQLRLRKKKVKSSSETLLLASLLAREAITETRIAGASLYCDEATANAPDLHHGTLLTSLLPPPTVDETVAAVPLVLIDMCLADGPRGNLIRCDATAAVIARGIRRSVERRLVATLLGEV
jgi:hypothetical protein